MTLYKHLIIFITLIITVILGVVLLLNYHSTKAQFIEVVYQSNVNNVSTLSDKLSKANNNKAILESILNSEFDSGYYQSIKYISNDDTSNYQQTNKTITTDYPEWFSSVIDINLPKVSATVSNGWLVLGEVVVHGDTDSIYSSLYYASIKLISLFVVSILLLFLVVSYWLTIILKPLARIESQAKGILNHKFAQDDKVPFFKEFRPLANVMNKMVQLIEGVINNASIAINENNDLRYKDPASGAFNKRFLLLNLPDFIAAHNKENGGVFVLIEILGASKLYNDFGTEIVQKIFTDISKSMMNNCQTVEKKLITKMNDIEYSLALSDVNVLQVQEIIIKINADFIGLLAKYDLEEKPKVFINFGVYKYANTDSISDIFIRTDHALSMAKSDECNNVFVFKNTDKDKLKGKEDWRNILKDAIINNRFLLEFSYVYDVSENDINHKIVTFNLNDQNNITYLYQEYISSAITLGLEDKIYFNILKILFSNNNDETNNGICTVRFPSDLVAEKKFFYDLSNFFEEHSSQTKQQFMFELSDHFVTHNLSFAINYAKLFKKYNYGFSINSYSGRAENLDYLAVLKPKYLKISYRYLLDQLSTSVDSLLLITNTLGIKVVATSVKTNNELNRLKALDISIVQGPITKTLG